MFFFFALPLLFSASLIFMIQPMLSRMILPMLGGTPAVWNTSMLFFQFFLLMGYFLAHILARKLSLKHQMLVYGIAILGSLAFLPPNIINEPPSGMDGTVLWQLVQFSIVIAIPFVTLSMATPLIQNWYALCEKSNGQKAYSLYAISNIGSFGGLLVYPFVMEPFLDLRIQDDVWAGLFIAYALCLGGLAIYIHKKFPATDLRQETESHVTTISWAKRAIWLGLAFVPSSLMLAITTKITRDVVSAPFLWVLPLALYLLTFVFTFSEKRIPVLGNSRLIQLLAIVLSILFIPYFMVAPLFHNTSAMITLIIVFFFFALACHDRLSNLKPATANLTEFYFILSLGGVLGGFFNAIIAPQIFVELLELPITLLLGLGLLLITSQAVEQFKKPHAKLITGIAVFLVCVLLTIKYFFPIGVVALAVMLGTIVILIALADQPIGLFAAFAVCFAAVIIMPNVSGNRDIIHSSRNDFGSISVYDLKKQDIRLLKHGTTVHGMQRLPITTDSPPERGSYYSPNGFLKDIYNYLDAKQTPQSIAVLGMGTGTMACFSAPDRSYDFYEIDPAVIEIVEEQQLFTYLSACGSPYQIFQGDARIELKRKADAAYDMIFVDTFSSDSIPTHMLTVEAIKEFYERLKPGGLLLFHLSNRYFYLFPILKANNAEIDGSMAIYSTYLPSDENPFDSPAKMVLLTKNGEAYNQIIRLTETEHLWMHDETYIPTMQSWHDTKTNILPALFTEEKMNEKPEE